VRRKNSLNLSILGLALLSMGMGGGFLSGKGELKGEIRLQIYTEAIGHYELAQSLYASGDLERALKEIQKATRTAQAFPEAYDLAESIYRKLGKFQAAEEQARLFKKYGGLEGASLYSLRDRLAEEIRVRQKHIPPDIPLFPSIFFSGILAVVLILGMAAEYGRLAGELRWQNRQNSIILDPFPEEEEVDLSFSWLFRTCLFLLPGPVLFALLVLSGLRHFSEVMPILIFGWAMIDLGIYLVFFADLSGLSGFRSSRQG